MTCEEEKIESIFYFIFGATWVIFGIWWVFNTYCLNRRHTKPLQRIMGFVVLFKLMNEFFLACLL